MTHTLSYLCSVHKHDYCRQNQTIMLLGKNSVISSCLHMTIWKDGDPCKVGIPATDIATGLYASTSIMAALFEKQKSGFGQKIDCNLLSTQV